MPNGACYLHGGRWRFGLGVGKSPKKPQNPQRPLQHPRWRGHRSSSGKLKRAVSQDAGWAVFCERKATNTCRKYLTQIDSFLPSLLDPRIGYIKVMFPCRAITGLLPGGCDDFAIITQFPFKSLRKVRGISPDFPGTIREAHLIHS